MQPDTYPSKLQLSKVLIILLELLSNKMLLSVIAILITFISFVPYIRSILKGTTQPHVFSWVIWSLVTFIVFLAQLNDNAGVGAWAIGVSGIVSIFVAYLAYGNRGDVSITNMDWLFLNLALSSIPVWYFTADPLWAVIILTTTDLLGFGPTLRKVYRYPYSEPMLFFYLLIVRNVLVIFALENYSLTTVLFPAAVSLACVVLISIIFFRRKTVFI